MLEIVHTFSVVWNILLLLIKNICRFLTHLILFRNPFWPYLDLILFLYDDFIILSLPFNFLLYWGLGLNNVLDYIRNCLKFVTLFLMMTFALSVISCLDKVGHFFVDLPQLGVRLAWHFRSISLKKNNVFSIFFESPFSFFFEDFVNFFIPFNEKWAINGRLLKELLFSLNNSFKLLWHHLLERIHLNW